MGMGTFLDGDEAIMGLMAKHFGEGKGITLFFYGQSYGFSLIEVFMIRLFYFVFGIGPVAIKLAMLTLWSIGVIFMYKTLKVYAKGRNEILVILITFAMIFSPAWMVWSMKARGGYTTAFTLSWIVLYLIANIKCSKSLWQGCLIGMLLVIILEAQSLWLAGLLPFIIYHVISARSWKNTLALTGTLILFLLLFHLPSLGSSSFWIAQGYGWYYLVSESANVPVDLYNNLTGNYIYNIPRPTTIVVAAGIFIFLGAVIGGLILTIRSLIRRDKDNLLIYISAISVIGCFAYLFIIDTSHPRYALPFSGFALLFLYFVFNKLDTIKLQFAIVTPIILFGAFSIGLAGKMHVDNPDEIIKTKNELLDKHLNYVYCEGGLLQWQLTYYSDEKIKARHYTLVDRYQPYVEAVDSAFWNDSPNVGLVVWGEHGTINVIPNPTLGELQDRGFHMQKR